MFIFLQQQIFGINRGFFFFFFFFPLQLLCRTHTKRGSADTKRIFCVHMYTAGSTKLSQYCLRHTCTRGAHTRIDACRLPALWCLCSLRNLSMHRLFNHFITKVTYSVIIATHTHRSQVRGAPIASVTLTNGSITKGSEAISTAVVWRRDDCNISIYSGECRCMLIKLDLPSATRLKWDEKITFMFGVGSSEV